MTTLNDLFHIRYGSQLDLNKMVSDEKGVNFAARTAKNLGVVERVKLIEGKKPFESGLITVALGGSILSSFVQQEPFYTAQNIMVLEPRKNMSFKEKVYYCSCIEKNKFRYSTFGREANRTLKDLKVPSKVPDWVNNLDLMAYFKEKANIGMKILF